MRALVSHKPSTNQLAGLLFLVALVHGLLYAVLIPPWQAPDETAHFEYSRLLAEHWRPVSAADETPAVEQEIIESLYRYQAWDLIGLPTPQARPARLSEAPWFGATTVAAKRFSTGYLPYALAVWPLLQQDVITQLYIMRSVAVLLGALVVVLAFQTAQLIVPSSPQLAIGAALFLIFLPQHAFIMATVNDGNLAELLATLVVYLLIRMVKGGFTWSQANLGLIATVVSVLAKPTAYFLIPLILVVGPLLRRRGAPPARNQSWQLSGTMLLLGTVIWLAVWGLAQPSSIRRLGYILNMWNRTDYFMTVLSASGQNSLLAALWGTFRSFWLTFGWMSLPLPEAWYYVFLALFLMALVGLAIQFGFRSLQPNQTSLVILGLAASLPIVILFSTFFVSTYGVYLFQGRYLFGGIAAQAILLVFGWLGLMQDRRADWALWAITTGLLLLDSLSFGLVISFYYS